MTPESLHVHIWVPAQWSDDGANVWLPFLMEEILAEDRAQTLKWGRQEHTPAEWGTILAEEFGELMKEVNEQHWRPTDAGKLRLRAEAIQTATLALKLAHMGGE